MRSGGRGVMRRSKIGRVITAPFRMITNAGNFYVRSMEGLAGRVGSGGGGGGGVGGPAISVPPTLPKSFSVSSSSREIYQEGKELKELERAASRRGNGGGGVGMGMRSYSVGIGKIGRIDEDEPCEFEEDKLRFGGANNKKGGGDLGLYYPRSKSHAIGRRNFANVQVNHNHNHNHNRNHNNNVGFVY